MPWETYRKRDDLVQQLDYNGTQNVVYMGEATKGSTTGDAVWRITYLTYDGNGNVLTKQFSPKFSTFGDIWSARAGLTYN